MKVKKSNYVKPYDKQGNTTLKHTNGKRGVYIIRIDGKIRYIGYSGSNLYKTLYRHFQSWIDPTQQRVTYKAIRNRATVRVVLTNRADQAAKLEKALILLYQPKDNPDKLERYTDTPAKITALASTIDDYEAEPCYNCEGIEEVPF